jgi:hypothetical protein
VPDRGVAFSTHTFRGIIIDDIEHLGFTATSATRSLSSVTKRNNHVHIEEQQYIENFERSSTRITGDNNDTITGLVPHPARLKRYRSSTTLVSAFVGIPKGME